MSRYTNKLSAENLIRYIANDYVELSHEKVQLMYHEHMRICQKWLEANEKFAPSELTEMDIDF